MEQYTTEYAREKNAGVLVHRIRTAHYLPLTDAERMTTHYLPWRTDAERSQDQRRPHGAAVTGIRIPVTICAVDGRSAAPDGYESLMPGKNRRIVLPDAALPLPTGMGTGYAGAGPIGSGPLFDGSGGLPHR